MKDYANTITVYILLYTLVYDLVGQNVSHDFRYSQYVWIKGAWASNNVKGTNFGLFLTSAYLRA